MIYSTRRLTVADGRRLTEIRAAAELVEPTDEIYDLDDVIEELAEDGVNLPAARVAIDHEVDHRAVMVACGMLMISPVTDKWRGPPRRRRSDTSASWIVGIGCRLNPHSAVSGIGFGGGWLASNESFADHWGSVAMDRQRWENGVTRTRAFLPGLSFVAQTCEATPQIVGFCLNDEYEAETRAHGFATGWISRLEVTRSGRGKGVASALLLTSLGAFQRAGYRDCALMVDADSPTGPGRIYQRVGSTIVDRNTTYLRELPPAR